MKRSKKEMIEAVRKNKIIVIIRGLYDEQLLKTAEALKNGGIRIVEITFDQGGNIPDEAVAANIHALTKAFGSDLSIGAGTVMTEKQVELAHTAGAEFIISPDTCPAVIRRTTEFGMLSIPGAFTPTEAANASRAGADFVKLFPNSEVSISYLKAIMVPLSHIRFLAVGGVNENNIAEYLAAGAWGVGVASGILNRQAIVNGDYAQITRLAQAYCRAARCEHAISDQ